MFSPRTSSNEMNLCNGYFAVDYSIRSPFVQSCTGFKSRIHHLNDWLKWIAAYSVTIRRAVQVSSGIFVHHSTSRFNFVAAYSVATRLVAQVSIRMLRVRSPLD